MMLMVCDSVKEVVCFGEGAGANILTRFAVSTSALYTSSNIRRLYDGRSINTPSFC